MNISVTLPVLLLKAESKQGRAIGSSKRAECRDPVNVAIIARCRPRSRSAIAENRVGFAHMTGGPRGGAAQARCVR
jgi:hypothetical protein